MDAVGEVGVGAGPLLDNYAAALLEGGRVAVLGRDVHIPADVKRMNDELCTRTPDGEALCCIHISCGYRHIAAVRSDGRVFAIGLSPDGRCDTEAWENVAKVACGVRHTVGLLRDGTCVAFLRSGSLSPFAIGDKDHPAPIMMQTRSHDGCKTWEKPEYFYDYGVLPVSRMLEDGTVLFASGRPGVYLRVSQDISADKWSDVYHVVEVPKEDFYSKYYEYWKYYFFIGDFGH